MEQPQYRSSSPPDALEQIFQGPLNWVNLSIIAVNILVFVIMEFFGDTQDTEFMLRCGAAYTPWILEGQWYRLFTSMFLHFGLSHLLNNMMILLFLGDMLEEYAGKWRYLVIYLGGGILGNLLSLYMDGKTGDLAVSAGASGAIFAVIGAIFVVLVKNRGQIRYMRANRVFLVFGLTIYHGFRTAGIDNAAHVGGVLGGMVLATILYRSPRIMNGRKREEGV